MKMSCGNIYKKTWDHAISSVYLNYIDNFQGKTIFYFIKLLVPTHQGIR